MLKGWNTSLCFGLCILLVSTAGAQNQDSASRGSLENTADRTTTSSQEGQPPQQLTGQQGVRRDVPLTAEQQANLQMAAAATIQQPQRPFPELPPNEAEYLGKFLAYWQQSSQQVKQYVCEFRRYEYDSSIVNYRDPTTTQLAAHSIAIGEIRYAEPDKGYYQTSQIWDFKAPPASPGSEAEYEQRGEDGEQEKWICDGRHVYEFDYANKRLYESEIPLELQGEGIINSPIPFLFGANKQQILERYWVRVIPKNKPSAGNGQPVPVEDEIWLEAYPKQIEDARLYSKIEVIIDKADFLPKAMHVYSPQYDPGKNNFQSRYFAFENRKVNDQLSRIKDFFGHFVRPQTPIMGGWKRITRNVPKAGSQAGQTPTANSNNGQSKNGNIR
jgi:TIGR03009 family protein